MRLRITAPDGTTSERVVAAAVVALGRDATCEVPFDPAVYPSVSGQHARIDQTPAGLVLTALSRSNKTLLNDQPVEGPAALKVGDRIRLGYSGPTVEVLAGEAARSKDKVTFRVSRPGLQARTFRISVPKLAIIRSCRPQSRDL
jgi:pSer/pThr/pTyr-binding forkhead associated (FHA) protein